MSKIGTSHKFVREVRIDGRVIGTYLLEFDSLPLPKVVWDMTSCKIGSIHTDRSHQRDETADLTSSYFGDQLAFVGRLLHGDKVDVLNHLLYTMGVQDSLMIRDHRTFSQNLNSIRFWPGEYNHDSSHGELFAGFPGCIPLISVFLLCNASSDDEAGPPQDVLWCSSTDGKFVEWPWVPRSIFRVHGDCNFL